MDIYIGSDYKGFHKKAYLKKYLTTLNYNIIDMGAHEYVEGDDFNDSAVAVAKAIQKNPHAIGILLCGSAHGVTMQANRFKHVRAAHCGSRKSAKLAREHDNANIICLSAELMTKINMQKIVTTFIKTEFKPYERRLRRIKRLDEREDYA